MGIRSKKNYEDAVDRWTRKGNQEWAKAKTEKAVSIIKKQEIAMITRNGIRKS